MERLANTHGIEPYGEKPWIKGMVGGSDDHSGIYIARAYTVSRHGESVVNSYPQHKTPSHGPEASTAIRLLWLMRSMV